MLYSLQQVEKGRDMHAGPRRVVWDSRGTETARCLEALKTTWEVPVSLHSKSSSKLRRLGCRKWLVRG